jgi:hypothetical protein
MTTQNEPVSGTDLSKTNLYGTSDDQLQNLKDAQQDILKGLESRYAQPNLWKVAAGFAKPQLGGFMASFGSAAEAMGENLEQQRAMGLPIAQMKAQIAQSNLILDKRQKVNKMLSDWSTDHPNEPMPSALLTEASKTDPDNPAVKAQIDQVRRSQEQQTLSNAQQQQKITALNNLLANGGISRNEFNSAMKVLNSQINPVGTLPTPNPENQPLSQNSSQSQVNPNNPSLQGQAPNPTGSSTDQNANPIQPQTPVKPIVISPSLPKPPDPDQQKSNAEAATRAEERANKRLANLEEVGAEENYHPLNSAVNSQIDLLSGRNIKDPIERKKHLDAVKRVTNIYSEGGIINGLLKGINTGVGVNLNALSAQIALPVEEFIRTKFNEEDQDLARTLGMNYALIALGRQKLGGVNPNQARNAELHLYGDLSPGINTPPLASLRSLSHLKNNLENIHEQYKFVNDVDQGQHPIYKLDPSTQTRLTDVFRHPAYSALSNPHNEQARLIEEAYIRQLKAMREVKNQKKGE